MSTRKWITAGSENGKTTGKAPGKTNRDVFTAFTAALIILSGTAASADVEVDIYTEPARVLPGEQVTARVIVSNSGTSTESDLQLTIPYPNNLSSLQESLVVGPLDAVASCTESGGSTSCSGGENLIFTLGNLAPGNSRYVALPVTVLSSTPEGTTINFQADVRRGLSDLASADTNITVDTELRLDLVIDESSDPVAATDQYSYRIRYGNRSDTSVTGTSLAFELPDDVEFVSASNGGIHNAGEVSWSLASLPAGSVGEQVVVVNAPPSAADGRLLSASASMSGINNALPTQQQAASVAMVGAGAPLRLQLSQRPERVVRNAETRLFITVTNPTSATVFGGTVEFEYPDELDTLNETLISGPLDADASCAGSGSSTFCSTSELVSFALGNLAAGASRELALPVDLSFNAPEGTLVPLRVRVRDDSGQTRSEDLSLLIESSTPLDVELVDFADPVAAGDTLIYRVRYGNRSTASVTGSTLELFLPPEVSFVSATDGGTLVTSATGNAVSWPLASIGARSSGERTVLVSVPPATSDGTLLEAAAQVTGLSDSLTTVQRTSEATHVGSGSALDLVMQLNPNPLKPGDAGLLELTVTNPSANSVFGSNLSIRLPAGLNSVPESFIGGSLDADASCSQSGSASSCSPAEIIRWNLGTMLSGAAAQLSFPFSISSGTDIGEQINIRASVQSDDLKAETTGDVIQIASEVPLRIVVDDNTDPLPDGADVTYAVRYGNASTSSVTGASISFNLPDDATVVSANGGAQLTAGVLTWPLGSLPSGTIGERMATLSFPPGSPSGTLRDLEAEIKGVQASLPVRALARSSLHTGNGTPLALSFSLEDNPILASEDAAAEVVVTNPSASLVSGAAVTMRYPTNLNSINESNMTGPLDADGSCSAGGASTTCTSNEFVTWQIGNVAAGQTTSLSLSPSASSSLRNGSVFPWQFTLTDDSGAYLNERNSVRIGTVPETGPIGSAILPVSRSVQVGETATAFATIINAGSDPALDCGIRPITSIAANFGFQITDPATNAISGLPNGLVDIPGGGGAQSFVFSFTPTSAIAPIDVNLEFDCANTDPAGVFTGLNTFLFSAETSGIPDVIGLTTTTDLQAEVNVGNAFAVGSANVGVTGSITATVDDGGRNLPLQLSLCQTDPMLGTCSSPIGSAATFSYNGGATASFAVFVTATAPISNDPANNRIFVRFTDSGGILRGATSTAVRTE